MWNVAKCQVIQEIHSSKRHPSWTGLRHVREALMCGSASTVAEYPIQTTDLKWAVYHEICFLRPSPLSYVQVTRSKTQNLICGVSQGLQIYFSTWHFRMPGDFFRRVYDLLVWLYRHVFAVHYLTVTVFFQDLLCLPLAMDSKSSLPSCISFQLMLYLSSKCYSLISYYVAYWVSWHFIQEPRHNVNSVFPDFQSA